MVSNQKSVTKRNPVLKDHMVPANVKFEVDDAEESWTFQHQFDFIHCRYLAAAISDWEKLVRQCFEATKPGGYTEFQDYNLRIYSEDGSLTAKHAEREWNDLGCGACVSFGKDPEPGPKIEGWMKDAGFVDCTMNDPVYRLDHGRKTSIW